MFQLFGVFMLATAAQKVLCVFGNRRTIGGLALRKKQFLVFGAVDVLLAWVVTQARSTFVMSSNWFPYDRVRVVNFIP